MKTRELCLAAVFTVLLSGGKFVLSVIPNVEIVTTLLIVFTLSVGLRRTLIPCFLFVLIDMLIYGVGTWVPMYLVYWPALCCLTACTRLLRGKKRMVAAIGVGIGMTAIFGVWTSFVDCVWMGGIGSGVFWQFFVSKYVVGLSFYAIHVVSNCVMLPFTVPLLTRLNLSLMRHYGFEPASRSNLLG